MTRSRRGLYAVYIIAAIIVCSLAAGLWLSVPEDIADYVNNGLMLPVFRYGLLFALIAYGVILSGERNPVLLVANFAVFASTLWFGLQRAEYIVVTYESFVDLIIRFPVVTTAMGMIAGIALLFPVRARRWLLPIVSACYGLGLGLFVLLESPLDYYYDWFAFSGGLSGMAVIIASIALANGVQQICTRSSFAIAERIFGSWLIAASLLLAALAIAPQLIRPT
ncbi:MAG: hypothetical protein KTR19_05575 [Hyphomicrobiales bacterium]|nr:hypothetical protein [Hyphomicrobiales bacterium]